MKIKAEDLSVVDTDKYIDILACVKIVTLEQLFLVFMIIIVLGLRIYFWNI